MIYVLYIYIYIYVLYIQSGPKIGLQLDILHLLDIYLHILYLHTGLAISRVIM